MSANIRHAARELYDLRRCIDDGEFVSRLDDFDPDELETLLGCWQLHARPEQLRPADCKPIWLVNAGRGYGKTRLGAEDILDSCEDLGPDCKVILASKTIGDVRKVMIKGESGLEVCARRRGYEIKYVPSHSMVYHPSGAEMYLVTSEKPDLARGLQSNRAWLDEISSWQNAIETFDNIMFGWRLPCAGGPTMVITTTPKPNPIMFRLMKSPELAELVTLTRGRTADNRDNLDPRTYSILASVFQGTRLGRQEMDGELLEGAGAIFDQDTIHRWRVNTTPELTRRVVSLDPSITAHADSDAAGILVLGSADDEAYVLADYTLETATFGQWARQTVIAFIEHDCDCVIAEVNQGGGGIVEAIDIAARDISREIGREVIVPVRSVWARESKRARAEPVGALYERGRVHHVGHYTELEKEQTAWLPGMDSPNRMDALVHGVTHLLLGDKTEIGPLGSYFR